MKLTYNQYCDYHASKCKICNGQKRIVSNGVWFTCSCQYNANVKWKYDQIQIYPEELKYKTWSDFTGIGISDRLTIDSFIQAKEKALTYCFGSHDISLTKNRSKNLIVHRHLGDGQNMIISGPKRAGKSLIATLVLKEIVYSCALSGKKIDFSWTKANEVIDACRWDAFNSQTIKTIDYELLDYLENVDFLFLDSVDLAPAVGNHRHPPDIISLNKLFGNRLSMKMPTIIMCSDRFYDSSLSLSGANEIKIQYGEEFYNMVVHPNNVYISLKKELKNA